MINISAPNVAIIVINWNNWRDTVECLGSLEKIDYSNFEVIIVDNGSGDNSAEKIEEYIISVKNRFQFSPPATGQASFKLFKLRDNLGFAGGNNYAINKVQDARYFLLLNNDTIVSPDFLAELIKVAESDDKIGIVGPMIYFYPNCHSEPCPKLDSWIDSESIEIPKQVRDDMHDINIINSAGSKINWLMNKGEYIGYNEKDRGQFGIKPYEADYISGACLLVKREVIEKIGPLSEDYFLYYEDTDWNFQARRVGYKSVLVPAAKIWHKESASAKKIGLNYVYYHVRNGLLFNRRCAPFYKRILTQFYNIYIIGKQIIKLFIPSKQEWAKATIRGMYDYYRGQFGHKSPACHRPEPKALAGR